MLCHLQLTRQYFGSLLYTVYLFVAYNNYER